MDMVERLKSYQNGVHGQFFLDVAAEIERLRLMNTLCNYSMDMESLRRDLTEGFVQREYHAQINPLLLDCKEAAIHLYRNDPMFHARVKSVVSGVMQIVQKYTP